MKTHKTMAMLAAAVAISAAGCGTSEPVPQAPAMGVPVAVTPGYGA
jgi:hypothetical protein